MQVCGPEVFMPSEVIISVSNDGKEFTELKRMEHKVVKGPDAGKTLRWL